MGMLWFQHRTIQLHIISAKVFVRAVPEIFKRLFPLYCLAAGKPSSSVTAVELLLDLM